MAMITEQFSKPGLRIECAGICRILIDDKYLLLANHGALKKGRISFSAIGGAYKLLNNDIENQFHIKWLRDKGEMRMEIYPEEYKRFELWFLSKNSERETNPYREFYEELIDELGSINKDFHYINSSNLKQETDIFFEKKDLKDVGFQYAYTILDDKGWSEISQIYKLIEVFDVILEKYILEKIRLLTLDEKSPFRLVTQLEIESLTTSDGQKIGNGTLALIADKNPEYIKKIFND